jgi:hypothetical protein
MLFAVSAKAGTSDRVNLHSGLSIEKILNDIDKNYIEKSYYYPLYNYYKYEA